MTMIVITNSVTGQVEQLVKENQADDILATLNSADVKENGESVTFEGAKYDPPPPLPPQELAEPLDPAPEDEG